MLSVIIPTLNAEKTLPATFASLMSALVDGMISEVIIADAGSTDQTAALAETTGAVFLTTGKASRGYQQKQGAKAARSDWLLFLHADTELEEGWHQKALNFIGEASATPQNTKSVAAFRFALKDKGLMPALLTRLVHFRCWACHLPYGDQGLLISKKLYEEIGGHAAIPIMEDVDLLKRLPHHPVVLSARAFTSAERYQKEGYLKRSLRNLFCLTAFKLGVSPEKIREMYEPTT